MNKHELDQLIFWMQEREELNNFKTDLGYNGKTKLIKKTSWSVFLSSPIFTWKREYELTELQRIELWDFLNEKVNHLDKLIEAVNPEDRKIANDILKGNVGRKALGM